MGGYPDPYDLAGWIANDLFLSSRLVVDTGMNSLGWTRQQAIDYMKRNTLESDTQIGTETLRYAVDIPAQALAYKWDRARSGNCAGRPSASWARRSTSAASTRPSSAAARCR